MTLRWIDTKPIISVKGVVRGSLPPCGSPMKPQRSSSKCSLTARVVYGATKVTATTSDRVRAREEKTQQALSRKRAREPCWGNNSCGAPFDCQNCGNKICTYAGCGADRMLPHGCSMCDTDPGHCREVDEISAQFDQDFEPDPNGPGIRPRRPRA